MRLRAALAPLALLCAVGCADIIGADFGDYEARGARDSDAGGGDREAGGSPGSGSAGAGASGGLDGATGGGSATMGGGSSAGATGAGGATGMGGFLGAGGAFPGGGTPGAGGSGGNCTAIAQRAERVLLTEYQPIALFVMIDRSGSMISGFPPPASAEGWNNASAALGAFVTDAASTGIEIGLGSFPYGPNNTASCADGADCGAPIVAIAPLPGNADPIIQAMQAQTPTNPISLTPTECALRGIVNQCLSFMAQSPTGEKCVGILVTDGTPTQCDTVAQNLAGIAAAGFAQGVQTFTLALPGADTAFLDLIAQAGGTTASLASADQTSIVSALNAIRGRVTQGTTTPTCGWTIPPAPTGTVFDPGRFNVTFVPSGSPSDYLEHVQSAADCGLAAPAGWYYAAGMTQIRLCPNGCSAIDLAGWALDVEYGCPTREVSVL